MKGRWILLAICGGGAMVLGTLGVLSSALLSLWGYAWRPWLTTVGFLVIPPLLIAAVLTGASILITKSGENKEAGYGHETLHWVGSTLVLCVGAALSWGMLQFGLLGLAFSHEPEHVVLRDGQKMLAVVNSFLDVTVEYHAYENAFLMGKQTLINEYYGSGGYEPFEREEMPTPQEIHDFRK